MTERQPGRIKRLAFMVRSVKDELSAYRKHAQALKSGVEPHIANEILRTKLAENIIEQYRAYYGTSETTLHALEFALTKSGETSSNHYMCLTRARDMLRDRIGQNPVNE